MKCKLTVELTYPIWDAENDEHGYIPDILENEKEAFLVDPASFIKAIIEEYGDKLDINCSAIESD